MKISDLINEKTVSFLWDQDKNSVLDTLIARAAELGLLNDVEDFRAAITTREAISSTGVGDAVAIPHATIPGIDSCFIITALIQPAVDWDALDQKPVSIVFLIGIPPRKHMEYLTLLGRILKNVKNADKRDMILKAENAVDIVRVLTEK